MTYKEWIDKVEAIRMQYLEGAITEREYFNAAVARAFEVEQEPEPELDTQPTAIRIKWSGNNDD